MIARTLRTPPTVHAPSSIGLQADNVLVARGEMRNRFDAAGFQCACDDQRVHANASHGAAIDVDGNRLCPRPSLFRLVRRCDRAQFPLAGQFPRRPRTLFSEAFSRIRFPVPSAAPEPSAASAVTTVPRMMRMAGRQCLHRIGHGANVRGRGAATAAQNAYASFGGLAREQREIFRRRFGVNDAIAFAFWEIRH